MSNLNGNLIFSIYSKYIENTDIYEIDIKVKYDLKEEKSKLWERLPKDRIVYLEDIFSSAKDGLHLVYLFLAVLEMYRYNEIEIVEDGILLKTLKEVV
jgi:segregation and condensation protein A